MKRRSVESQGISRRLVIKSAAAMGGLALMPGTGFAQTYPSKPIKIIVGFTAGGAADLIARIVGAILSSKFGQPVTVENQPGASGGLATEAVATAPADGYTLLVAATPPIAVNPHTYKNMRVNPITDLEHITMVGEGNWVLGINAGLKANTFAELVELSKSTPGGLRFGTTGNGGGPHLVGESIRLQTGANISAVHYRGASQALPDLLSNQIQMLIISYTTLEPHVKSGDLRILLTFDDEREPMAPEVPTAGESGYPDLDKCKTWVSLHAPKGTPDEVLNTLHGAIVEYLEKPEYLERMVSLGFPPVGNSPAEFKARLDEEYRIWGEIATAANVVVE